MHETPGKVRTTTDAAASGAAGRWRHENHRSCPAGLRGRTPRRQGGRSVRAADRWAACSTRRGVRRRAERVGGGYVAAAAVEVAHEYGWRSVAVRSSARDEDGATSSGAGAYATVLNVSGDDVDAMASAVETVLASIGETGGVIVQRMVAPDAAGVVFTIDPVTGAAFLVVNAVAGLGETLVSGAETPWEARIPREGDGSVRGADIVADDGPVELARSASSWASRSKPNARAAARKTSSGPSPAVWSGSCNRGPSPRSQLRFPSRLWCHRGIGCATRHTAGCRGRA